MTDLLEAKIKVCYNYSGFILAFIRINDQKGNFFTVQTYSLISGKWLMERQVKIHGSFKRQAAIEFDEFNSECEQFSFIGNLAIPPKKFEFKERKLNVEISSREYQTKAKVFNVENQAKSTANKKEKREVWIES